VLAETIEDGGQEFLAVTTLPGTAGVEEAAEASAIVTAVPRISAMQMPLPYALPMSA
jgi:hypothetical protein